MNLQIQIDIKSYWHPGGGRGQGMVLDATCHRDRHGLPVLPGRHLKGLLRDALERAEQWKWGGYEGLADTLFGERTEQDRNHSPKPGALRVGDARLPEPIVNHLSSDAGKDLIPGLFRPLYSTAIDHKSGTADDQSLRGVEVVVPLTIHANLTPIPGQNPPDGWNQKLKDALHLIDAVGAHRNRGLGRAVLTLEEDQ